MTKPGDTISGQFTTRRFDTGAATNATGMPVGTLVLNGANTGEAVTVVNVGTGLYSWSVAVPAAYSSGDDIEVRINATVNLITDQAIIFRDTVDAKRVADLNDASAPPSAAAIAAAVELAILNEGDMSAVLEAIRLKIEESDDDLTTDLIRNAILDRVLPGNHDTANTVGEFIQRLSARLGVPTNGSLSADIADKTGYKLAADGLDLVLVTAGVNVPLALRYIGASAAGDVEDAGTATELFYDFAGVLTLTIPVDASGNRTNIIYS